MHRSFKIKFPAFILFCFLLCSGKVLAQFEPPDDSLQQSITIEEPPAHQSVYDTSLFDPAQQKDIEIRKVDDTKLSQLKKDDAFWYANAPIEKPAASVPLWQQGWFKTLMWFVIGATFIVIIAMFLSASDIFLFRKKSRKKTIDAEGEEVQEDIYTIDFEKEIARALNKGDHRLAIRYLYLQKLKELADDNIIQYRQERTNQDYVMQLFGTPYYAPFFNLTRHFEYAWYGKFEIGPERFHIVESLFRNFKTTGKAA